MRVAWGVRVHAAGGQAEGSNVEQLVFGCTDTKQRGDAGGIQQLLSVSSRTTRPCDRL